MKHDYRTDSSSAKADTFLIWLENETTAALRRDYGNIEAVKASLFLYINRAYEAGLPDNLVGGIFGECIEQAGYDEAEQESALDWLESIAPIAKATHSA